MANYLKFTYQHIGNDSSVTTFTDVDNAKNSFSFADWDFGGRTPQYALEDGNKTLAVTISFTDAEAHVEMKAFHENVKNNWNVKPVNGLGVIYSVNNAYVINDTQI